MAITNLSPYITLRSHAVDAIDHYRRWLGATPVDVTRSGDVHGASGNAPERIVHAVLRVGNSPLLLSDDSSPQPSPVASLQLALEWDDLEDMTQRFTAFAEGGTITLPLQDTFWGAQFGMLVDRFGVRWMFNCQRPSR